MDIKAVVLKKCVEGLHSLGVYSDERYKNRLQLEIKEIEAQMEYEYFFDLCEKQAKFSKNENNLLVVKLLGLADDFNIEDEPEYLMGEFPDIDIDYLPMVRDYLKNEWAQKYFGIDNVCSIGNYTTFGIKSSLIDMAKIHGNSRQEILDLTTKIGLKDEDGKVFTWDKALEQYPDLKKYCLQYPDVADAASRLLNRNRGMGKHAGGLIISSKSIDSLVPLVRGKEGEHVSAFVEGLSGTDLGPLGLIKFDMLVITNLVQIAKACKIIKERHPEVKSICALSGKSDWSDTSYLEDPIAIKLANEGKLKCIFQFDSEGIRDMVRKGGVTCFDDLAAYSALWRPGPLGMKMDERFIERKRGREKYEIHPVLRPILGSTYGVLVFQEQIMKILSVVGKIPDMHCELVRKAISKKKVKIFSRYKEMFLKNGQIILGWTAEKISELWDQIESFAEYGFNKAHSVAYTYISSRLLWLKSHYPVEFFTAVLSCEKDHEKTKEYKHEAEGMNIKLEKIDLNKSKVKFDIHDDVIYMGFANIKGVGDEVAQRIVDNQPYKSFEDFLVRFGTDAKVLKPLISLRTFTDADPPKLYEYYEYYKAEKKKVDDRNNRFIKTKEKNHQELMYIIPEKIRSEIGENILDLLAEDNGEFAKKQFYNYAEEKLRLGEDEVDAAWKIVNRYKKSLELNIKKNQETDIVSLADFESSGELDTELKKLMCEVIQFAENEFYGFSWKHLLESSPDYQGGRTFSDFDEDEGAYVRMCELHVSAQPKMKKSTKGNPYYLVLMEDANSRSHMITFWQEDFERFREELEYWQGDVRKGHFVRIRLKRPEPPFRSYTFESPQKQFRWKEVPKDKADDCRLQIMLPPTMLENTEYVHSEHKVLIDVNFDMSKIKVF